MLVDDRIVVALKRPGAVTEAAPNAWLRRGFRTDAVEIAEGDHRVRISADGYAVVDRLRLLPDLEQGILAWTTSPEAWISTLAPQTLQVATTADAAELSARVSGPGLLTFDWNTRSRVSEPYVDFLLDGVRLHQLLSTASSPWSMKTDLPPGMHTCTFRIPLVRPFQIQNVKVTPGAPPLAASAASDPLFRWSNVGSHWVLEPDLLRAPVDGGSGNDELVALVPGFSFVSWPSDALAGRAKLRNGFPVHQPLSLGDRKGFLLDRADTWTMSWTSGSGGSDSFVRDVQVSPLVEVTVAEALEVPAGWTFSLPDDRKWHALKGIPGAFDSWVDGDALVTSVRDNESPSTVRAAIQGPTRSVFTWGAPEGLAEFGAGTFTRAGVGLLQYGNKIILARDPVTKPEHCILDFPAGLHECGWTGWPCYSLAVDNLGPAAGPGIAEVLEAPDLPWAVASASRDLTGQVEIVGGNDVLRVESPVAAGVYGQVATQVVGPALLHCRVRVAGVVDVILGSERTSIGSTDWRDMTFAIEETGLTHVAFAPSEDATLWLDAVRIEAAGPVPVAAGPAEAAGAANLAWEWVDGWKAANNPVVALDENGYAEGTFTIAAHPAAATLRVQGPGILGYRAYSTGDLRVRDGASELLGTVLPVFYWTSFRHLLGDGSHTVTFAANGLLRLDAVTWTPALATITKTNALSDADGDGVPLVLEHAFGMSDSMPDASVVHEGISSGLPSVDLTGTAGAPRLRLRYLQRHSGVRYIPEFADSLHGEWQAAPESSIRLIDSLNGLWSRYEAIDPAPPGRTNRFARVRVEIAP